MCIENNTGAKIRLVGKDWNITDDRGNRYNDSSAGFKGELPELEPGQVPVPEQEMPESRQEQER